MDSNVKTFLNSRVADQSSLRSKATTENTTRVVIPFKDQESANIVKKQLKDLIVKLQTTVQPVFTSREITQETKVIIIIGSAVVVLQSNSCCQFLNSLLTSRFFGCHATLPPKSFFFFFQVKISHGFSTCHLISRF